MGEDPREIGEMWTCSAVSALKSVIGECGECLGFDLFDDTVPVDHGYLSCHH